MTKIITVTESKNNSKTRSVGSFSFHSFQCVNHLLRSLVLMFLILNFVLQINCQKLFFNCLHTINIRLLQYYVTATYLFSNKLQDTENRYFWVTLFT